MDAEPDADETPEDEPLIETRCPEELFPYGYGVSRAHFDALYDAHRTRPIGAICALCHGREKDTLSRENHEKRLPTLMLTYHECLARALPLPVIVEVLRERWLAMDLTGEPDDLRDLFLMHLLFHGEPAAEHLDDRRVFALELVVVTDALIESTPVNGAMTHSPSLATAHDLLLLHEDFHALVEDAQDVTAPRRPLEAITYAIDEPGQYCYMCHGATSDDSSRFIHEAIHRDYYANLLRGPACETQVVDSLTDVIATLAQSRMPADFPPRGYDRATVRASVETHLRFHDLTLLALAFRLRSAGTALRNLAKTRRVLGNADAPRISKPWHRLFGRLRPLSRKTGRLKLQPPEIPILFHLQFDAGIRSAAAAAPT